MGETEMRMRWSWGIVSLACSLPASFGIRNANVTASALLPSVHGASSNKTAAPSDHSLNAGELDTYGITADNRDENPLKHDYVRLLRDVSNYLEQQKMPWSLIEGTLLGQKRDEKIIPWDSDADIGVASLSMQQLLKKTEKHGAGRLIKIPGTTTSLVRQRTEPGSAKTDDGKGLFRGLSDEAAARFIR